MISCGYFLRPRSRVKLLGQTNPQQPAPVTNSYPFVVWAVADQARTVKNQTRAHGKYVRYDPPKTEFYVERVPWAVKYLDRRLLSFCSELDQALDTFKYYWNTKMFEELSK